MPGKLTKKAYSESSPFFGCEECGHNNQHKNKLFIPICLYYFSFLPVPCLDYCEFSSSVIILIHCSASTMVSVQCVAINWGNIIHLYTHLLYSEQIEMILYSTFSHFAFSKYST